MAVQQYLMMGRAAAGRTVITGERWVWGKNPWGSLGVEHEDPVGTPVQLGSLTNWQNTDSPGATEGNMLTVKSDGTLWAWGRNNSGALGLGDTTQRTSPVQVGSLTDWVEAGCYAGNTAAIKTDGTLWTWGYNGTGALGNGNTTDISSPAQVGSATDWAHAILGGGNTDGMLVMKTDGTLYYSGTAFSSGLSAVSTPTQLGSETGFVDGVLQGTNLTMWKEA